jgi:outer membrane receptor protein involved in Fe transport
MAIPTQPTIQQIQPVRTNDDPLNISIGNPGLKPQFTNSFNVNFNDYKVLSNRGVYIGANYRFTQNSITNSTNVDAQGKKVYQSVNVDGNTGYYGYLGYSFKWKKPDIQMEFQGDINGGSRC